MRDLFNLDDKIAVVFGGNGYLGKQFCKSLLEYGAKVYSCDMNIAESEETKALQGKYSKRFQMTKVDAASKQELIKLREHIIEKDKRVDVLVNTTTMKGKDFYLPFEEVSLEGWNIGLLGNLTIPFLTIQALISVFLKQREGSIINIASHYGMVGNDQRIYEGSNLHKIYVKDHPEIKQQVYSHGGYNAAKGGLINFTRYLAAYYGKYNIRVNCISPGGVYREDEDKVFVRKYSEKTPLGRKAKPNEINGAVIFLASDASTYVTGHNLVVDGGYTIW